MFYGVLCKQSLSIYNAWLCLSMEAETRRNVTFSNVLKYSCDQRPCSSSFMLGLLIRVFLLRTVATLTCAEMT